MIDQKKLHYAKCCIDCKRPVTQETVCGFAYDHKPGCDKITEVSQMRAMPWEKITAEIDKCELRCCICHAIITKKRRLNVT